MREAYAKAVRELSGEGRTPSTSMFRDQEVLMPFLLACNESSASTKLITVALSSIQRLLNRDAIDPGDAPNVMRVLVIQASSATAGTKSHITHTHNWMHPLDSSADPTATITHQSPLLTLTIQKQAATRAIATTRTRTGRCS